MPPTYSEAEMDAAIALALSSGIAEASRQTGIARPTIFRWLRKAGLVTDHTPKTQSATIAAAARADQLRAELRGRLLEKALDLLNRMDAVHVDFKGKGPIQVEYPIAPAAAVQNYATSVGILIDKYRLEVGEATSRSESRSLDDAPDDLLRDLLREADRIASEGRVAATSEGAPAGDGL